MNAVNSGNVEKTTLQGKVLRVLMMVLMVLSMMSIGGALSLIAPSKALADESAEVALNVYEMSEGDEEASLVKQYTASELAALESSSTDPQAGLYGSKDGWKLSVAYEYVALADLLADAGVEWASGDAVNPTDQLDRTGFGSASGKGGFLSLAYDDLYAGMFYPNTAATGTDTSGAAAVEPVLALSEASTGSIATTAADAVESLAASASADKAPRMVVGITEEQYLSDEGAAGRRLASNVKSVTVIHPESAEVALWKRLSGDTRYQTGAAIIGEAFTKSEVAVVATGVNFPDALAASALAGAYDAPVILTQSDALTSEAQAALESLEVEKVFIMGGEAAVSLDVEEAIEALNGGIEAERVAGSSRIATSYEAYLAVKEKQGAPDTVILATASNFPDTLSIGPWSYAANAPILLVSGDAMNSDVEAAVAAAGNVIIVGGTGAVSQSIEDKAKSLVGEDNVERLSGADRYATSAAIAEWEMGESDAAVQPDAAVLSLANPAVATGANFPDALAGAALCGTNGSVLVLADSPDHPTVAFLSDSESPISLGYFLGGEAAVSADLAEAIISSTDAQWFQD